DVVFCPAFLRQPHQVPAGFRRRKAAHGITELVLGDVAMEPISALYQDIPALQNGSAVVDLYRWMLTDAAREHRAQVARHRLFFRDEAELELHRHIRVIRCQLADLSLSHEIRTGISDVPDRDLVSAE